MPSELALDSAPVLVQALALVQVQVLAHCCCPSDSALVLVLFLRQTGQISR
jgi:hypothetical protein